MGSKDTPRFIPEPGLKGQEAACPNYFLDSYKKRSMGFSPYWQLPAIPKGMVAAPPPLPRMGKCHLQFLVQSALLRGTSAVGLQVQAPGQATKPQVSYL